MNTHYNLLATGIGPFHLSLAAMLEKLPAVTSLFIDQRTEFRWHPEIIFDDADMQTSFYKDLVTPVDPTSRHSYLNFLVEHGLFYAFMNTGRRTITRREFELYGKWVSERLENLKFNSSVKDVEWNGKHFVIKTDKDKFTSDHFSFATGSAPFVPDFTKKFLGENVFHPKSGKLANLDITGKRVVIIGGGQTGVEIFRNALNQKWGRPESLKLVSRRNNLEPLDESPFTNEYFSPAYSEEFFPINPETKASIVASQKLASDGNTPAYLELLYKDLYFKKHVMKDSLPVDIYPKRTLTNMTSAEQGYTLHFQNTFTGGSENVEADIVILSTGLETVLPPCLQGLKNKFQLDEKGRPVISHSFRVSWDGPAKIYALNFSRHSHGISEPQTSLMAWRSAKIINDLVGTEFYKTSSAPGLLTYGNL